MAESAADVYDRYWTEGVGGWHVAAGLSEGMADLLRSVSLGMDVLDYGGGDGRRYADVIKAVASEYIVADVSPFIVRERQAAGDHAIQIDALDGTDMVVDTLVILEVLEHLLDPLSALTLALSKVRPGGRVVLSVPNAFSGWDRLRVLGGRLPASGVGAPGVAGRTWTAPHVRFFDWPSLLSLARRAGIEVTAGYADGLNVWKMSGRFNGPLRELTLSSKHHLLAHTFVLVGNRHV